MSNTDSETGVLMAISCDSREEVSQIVNRAVEVIESIIDWTELRLSVVLSPKTFSWVKGIFS
ncbi:hypothetical protein [Oligoflexus tunisiensis]|uniref:hypothetical protein n=1 Tax=Oligoflexus tunisiensis TaxID=708132 RepID=UPI001C406302|nr:hypothetical protein [Oligoflexus tunisiensis]